jgi:hypothetical protein
MRSLFTTVIAVALVATTFAPIGAAAQSQSVPHNPQSLRGFTVGKEFTRCDSDGNGGRWVTRNRVTTILEDGTRLWSPVTMSGPRCSDSTARQPINSYNSYVAPTRADASTDVPRLAVAIRNWRPGMVTAGCDENGKVVGLLTDKNTQQLKLIPLPTFCVV